MRKLLYAFLGLLAVGGPAHAVLITFDEPGTVQTAPINAFYSGLGVTFSSATWQNAFGLNGTSSPNGLGSTGIGDAAYKWTSATPVIATFSFAVSTISLVASDVGINGFTLNAYDAVTGGNLVDTMTVANPGGNGLGNGSFNIMSVSAASIFRVEMFQDQDVSIDGLVVDNFRFTAAPEPGTFGLLALALAGGGVLRRRAK